MSDPYHFDFSDSEVRRVEAQGPRLRVVFSAAQVRRGATAGYAQSLEMVFEQATWTAALAECIGRLRDGHVTVAGARQSRLALPFESSGVLTAELVFGNGTLLSVRAASLLCRFTGDPQFLESMAC